ncbi:hypa-like protein [Stemphylium lycopersici]|uniref:Hypa-like protein n=1 Tax=Stemphylium lycopersici TaxID=183478 RepID=A0A364MYE3_STELY|nr:hypa-like protein [Stemphylium lycopersici]RAR07150.1 hypa-like protein [Stemphylium lycopersici]
MATAAIQISPSHAGLIKAARKVTPESLEQCNKLLQKNHEECHMFFRDTAGHNHIVHSLLTILAMGAGPEELKARYEDGVSIQRAMPSVDFELLQKLRSKDGSEVLYNSITGHVHQYHTFLEFFKGEIKDKGWKDVIQENVLARSKLADLILARMYEGAYHPIIHLGLGVEFKQPVIIAEALAQAAAHDDARISTLFRNAEQEAEISYPSRNAKSMLELVREVRGTDAIRNAPKWTDFGNKMRDGIIGRAGEEMASLVSQFRIKNDEEDLERRTAEMISTCAYFAGAAQDKSKINRKTKIDFFYMHCVTSSIFFSVFIKQDWIKLEDRVRLVEWKARLDLAWYAVSGCAVLEDSAISGYHSPMSDGMAWDELFEKVIKEHDDGHAAKFIRALKNGEESAKQYEQGEYAEYFPMKGDMWLRLARMCQDTTESRPSDLKWVPFTGFEQPWKRPDLLAE